MSSNPATSAIDDDGPEEGEIEDDEDDESSPPASTTTNSSSPFVSRQRKKSYDRDIREFEMQRARARRVSADSWTPRTMGTTRGNDPYVESPTRTRIKDKHKSGPTHGKENRRIHRERDQSIIPVKKSHGKKDKHEKESRHNRQIRLDKDDKYDQMSGDSRQTSSSRRDSSSSSVECEENMSADASSHRRLRHKPAQRERRKLSSSSDTEHGPVKRKSHSTRCPLIKVLQDVAKETRLAIEAGDGSSEEQSLRKRLCNMGALSASSDVVGERNIHTLNDRESSSNPLSKNESGAFCMANEIGSNIAATYNDASDDVTFIGSSRKVEPEVVTLTDSEDCGVSDFKRPEVVPEKAAEPHEHKDKSQETNLCVSSDDQLSHHGVSPQPATVVSDCEEDDIGRLRLLALQSKKIELSKPEDEDDLQLRLAALKTAIVKKFKGRKKGIQQVPRSGQEPDNERLSPIDDIPFPCSPKPNDELITPVDMDLAETDDESDTVPLTPERYSPSYLTESPAQELSIQELLPPPPPPDLPLEMYFSDVGAGPSVLTVESSAQLLPPPPLPSFFRDMLNCIQEQPIPVETPPSVSQLAPESVCGTEQLIQIQDVVVQGPLTSLNDFLRADPGCESTRTDFLSTVSQVSPGQNIASGKLISSSQARKQATLRPNLRPIPLNNGNNNLLKGKQQPEAELYQQVEDDLSSIDLESMIVLDEVYDNSPGHEIHSVSEITTRNEIDQESVNHVHLNVEDDEETLRKSLLLELSSKRESVGNVPEKQMGKLNDKNYDTQTTALLEETVAKPAQKSISSVAALDISSASSPVLKEGVLQGVAEAKNTSLHQARPLATKPTVNSAVLPTISPVSKADVRPDVPPAMKTALYPTSDSLLRVVRQPQGASALKIATNKAVQPGTSRAVEPPRVDTGLTVKSVIDTSVKPPLQQTVVPAVLSAEEKLAKLKHGVTAASLESDGTSLKVFPKPAGRTNTKSAIRSSKLKSNKNRLVYSTSANKNLQVVVPVSSRSSPGIKPTHSRPSGHVSQAAHMVKPLVQENRLIINLGNDSDDSNDDYSEAEALGQRCVQNKEAWNRTILLQMQEYDQNSSQKAATKVLPTSSPCSAPKSLPRPKSVTEDDNMPVDSRDLESSIDRFLKGVRSTHDAAKASLSAKPAARASLNSTPVAVRNLPVSKQEEYRRLKQEIAKREMKMELKKQNKVLKNDTSIKSAPKSSTLASSNHISVANKLHVEDASKKVAVLRVQTKPNNAINNSKFGQNKQILINSPGGTVSGAVQDIHPAPHNVCHEIKTSNIQLATAGEEKSTPAVNLQSVTPVTVLQPNLATSNENINITQPVPDIEKRGSCSPTRLVHNLSGPDVTFREQVQDKEVPLREPVFTLTFNEDMLQDLEVDLLSERSDVLDELSRMVALLAQVDTALEAQCRTANEVSSLVDQLTLATGRWRAQNRLVTDMVGRVAQHQKDLSEGHKRFVTILKKCSDKGKELHGLSYKVPSDGAGEMRAQLKLVHEQTQSLAQRRTQEQEKKKKLWKRADDCLSRIKLSEKQSSHLTNRNKAVVQGTGGIGSHLMSYTSHSPGTRNHLACNQPSTSPTEVPVIDRASDLNRTSLMKTDAKKSSILQLKSKSLPSNICPGIVSKILVYRYAQKKLRSAKSLLNTRHCKQRVSNCRRIRKRCSLSKCRSLRCANSGTALSDMEISSDGEDGGMRDCRVVDMSVSPDTCSSPSSLSHNSTEGGIEDDSICSTEGQLRISVPSVQLNSGSGISVQTEDVLLKSRSQTQNFDMEVEDSSPSSSSELCHMEEQNSSANRLNSLEESGNTVPRSSNSNISLRNSTVLKDYVSPLGGLRVFRNDGLPNKSNQDDPHAFLCPYDLNGKCKDVECPFRHQL